MTSPRLLWDWGTAYDLFVSLLVLHNPEDYEVPGAWAAGMRARVPAAEREMLDLIQFLVHVPLHWLPTLPEPKDGAAVLWTLGQVPPEKRLRLLTCRECEEEPTTPIFARVAARGAWDEKDRDALRTLFQKHGKHGKSLPSPARLASALDCWAHLEQSGERLLQALRAYQEAFFAEEENRIRPALQQALARAQEQAGQMSLTDLLEELSQGLRFAGPPGTDESELMLVPSYWSTPLVVFGKASATRDVWVFGARQTDASLVPGSTVPDTLLRVLEALSDPTRLRILQYLAQEPLTPAQITRRLRLRAPTVTHHLRILRLASLVQLTIGENWEPKTYSARLEAVAALFSSLHDFLRKGKTA